MGNVEAVDELVADWRRLRDVHDEADALELGQRLLWIGRLLEQILDDVATEAGFSRRGDYEVLALLYRSEDGFLSPIQVSDRLRLSPSGVTGKLDRLQREGLLERRQDPNDRRALRLYVTERGRASVNDAFERALVTYQGLMSSIDAFDSDMIRQSLKLIHQHVANETTALPKPLPSVQDQGQEGPSNRPTGTPKHDRDSGTARA